MKRFLKCKQQLLKTFIDKGYLIVTLIMRIWLIRFQTRHYIIKKINIRRTVVLRKKGMEQVENTNLMIGKIKNYRLNDW